MGYGKETMVRESANRGVIVRAVENVMENESIMYTLTVAIDGKVVIEEGTLHLHNIIQIFNAYFRMVWAMNDTNEKDIKQALIEQLM